MTHASIAGPTPHARPHSARTGEGGAYGLPRLVQERLQELLAGRRNAGKALALATFLGRFWSAPARLGRAFPVDRRQLADRADLGLSEEEIRGATTALEEVGFLVREVVPGSVYRVTAEGQRRKPILRRFGSAFFPSFVLANEPRRRRDRQRQTCLPPHKDISYGRLMGGESKSPLEQAIRRFADVALVKTKLEEILQKSR